MNCKKSKHTKPQRKEAAAEPAAVHETVDKRVRRKHWTRVFTALACVVVFATTYTLILPAITAEKEDMTGTEITAEESVIQSEVRDPEPGSLVEIAGEESHIGIIVETGVSEEGEPVVFVLENTEESGLQVTEQPMDDSVVSVLTPEEAVQVEGLEEEVLYLVQAAEEEGILEPEEREALEGDVQESLEELGVVDSSAAPQNDDSDVTQSDDDVILSEAKDLEEDSSAQVPQNDNEVLAPQDDNGDVIQNDEDVTQSDDDVILSEAKDLEEDSSAMPQNDIEVPTIAAEAVTDGSNGIITSVLQGTILQQTVNGVTVTARWDEGVLPEGTEMKVEPVEAEEYKDLVDEALGAAKAETQSLDITFLNNGKEIEPNGDVQITFRADFIDKEASPEVVHIKSDGTAEVMDTNVVNDEIKLTANSFSVYVIRYTVDFHWEAAGQVYDYSFAGGSYIDMQTLVEVLGISEGDASTFVVEIENMEFSDPSLVWVGKANEDTTVGALKEANGLECEYSAELTEAEIAEINARTVAAGTWALISLKPFDTEEYLEVTMKNGDEWILRVTDAHEIPDSSADTIDVNKSYLICYQVGDQYYLLKNDGSVNSSHTPDNFEHLNSTYCWSFNYVFEEKHLEETLTYVYYLIRPIDNKSKTIALYAENNELVESSNNNVAVVPAEGGGFNLIGYNNVKLNFMNGEFFADELPADDNGIVVHIYEMDALPTYSYTARSDDEERGTVTISGGTERTDANGHYYEAESNSDKKNDGVITATPVNHKNEYLNWWETGYGQNKWQFDHWEQDGVPLDRDQYPATINADTLPIPFNGSNLVAYFKQNPNYVVPDSEKEPTTFDDMTNWLNELGEKHVPLDEDATKKTAEVYDYENRIYRVDIESKANFRTFKGNVDMAFCMDVSNSMYFPSKLVETASSYHGNPIPIYQINNEGWGWSNKEWLDQSRGWNNPYYLIADQANTATVFKVYYQNGNWKAQDASRTTESDRSVIIGQALDTTWTSGVTDKTHPFNAGDDNNSTYMIYDAGDNGRNRFYYLNQSFQGAIHDLTTIKNILAVAGNASPNVRFAYNTFNKELGNQRHDFQPVYNIGEMQLHNAAGGGTRPDQAFNDAQNFNWQGDDRYVILITDGAPQGKRDKESLTAEQIVQAARDSAAELKKGKDHIAGTPDDVKVITVGLSLDKVPSGKKLLYDIADKDKNGDKMFFMAESASDLPNILRQITKTIMDDAVVYADVTDTVGDAFYPVDKTTGLPLLPGNMIDIEGRRVTDSAEAAGIVQSDGKTIKWLNQAFDPQNGWHGTVYVKAKEDLLGGNAVKTNGDAGITATKYKMGNKEYTFVNSPIQDKLKSLHVDLETPRVNVNELTIPGISTEWTVYLGTEVDPKEQLKKMYEGILVQEVVNTNDGLHYELSPNSIVDNRTGIEDSVAKTFPLAPEILEAIKADSTLSAKYIDNNELKWDEFLTDTQTPEGITIPYHKYGIEGEDSNIVIKLSKTILGEEETDLVNHSPHPTVEVNGTDNAPVEKYVLTVQYNPDYDHVLPPGQGGKNSDAPDYHTGTYGTMYQGHAAGRETSTNTHVINVFAKKLQIVKSDQAQNPITGSKATFGLYRKATETEMNDTTVAKVSLEGVQQNPCVLVQTLETANGTVTTDALPLLDNNESYYLKEIQAPDGYNLLSDVMKVSIDMTGHNTWTKKSNNATFPSKPDPYELSDWQQKASIKVTDLEGNASTYVVLPTTITYDSVNDTTDASVTYKIINTSGYELPSTGGPGEEGLMLAGGMMVIGAAVLLIRRFTARIR